MALLLIVSLVWAFSFGLIKTRLGNVDANVVSGVRLVFSLVVFVPFLKLRAVGAVTALRLVLVGAVQFGLTYMAYIAAYRSLSAYEVAVLTIFTPFWVCLFDDLLTRHFTARAYVAAAVAVIGTGVILVTRSFTTASAGGVLLMQASNACFAFGQVHYKRMRSGPLAGIRDRDVFGWMYAGAVAVTLPFAAPHAAGSIAALTATQWSVLAYLGVLASGVCFFLWNVGALRVSAATLAVMNNLKVPLAVACSLLFFGEKADPLRLLGGGALIGLALWIARQRKSRS